ncbi:MAG: ribokinase [Candidatus Methanolliviera hydrocarbonicum]|uniref:Ribokinase n=1 Tax=Candidatus Methanolliviera hydrocarbonicum TaxID=2491085 RepID=A0A520KWX5_9EURY|nr:MAG: ribokinase [Candidatus Methanolliviera hydrocarbonicum]
MGSFIVDLMARAPHLPATGETVKGSVFEIGPGGKGSNQGVAAHRLGSNVTMITKIGTDFFGHEVALRSFQNEGMDTSFIFKDDKLATGTALIMVDENTSENKIVVTPGACDNITESEIEKARGSIETSEVFLTQLETNMEAVEKAVDIAHAKGVKIILNPAPARKVSEEILKKIDILTPNEVEASILSGVQIDTMEDAKKAARTLMSKGVGNVIITLGSNGALVVTAKDEKFIESPNVDAVDTTGAGDAYNGGLATALAEGMDIFEAAEFANTVGALSVTKIGTSPAMPYREDLDRFLKTA